MRNFLLFYVTFMVTVIVTITVALTNDMFPLGLEQGGVVYVYQNGVLHHIS